MTVSNTSVKIIFNVERPVNTDSAISISALFSNNTASLVTEYTLQVAVTKVDSIRHESNSWTSLTDIDRGSRSSLNRSLGGRYNQIKKME